MAEYTIELRDVVKNHNIFDFKYPFYDPSKQPDFERKFINHFYFHEIGCETVDRFKHYLRDKMETVFPYYNELMRTTTIDYSVLDNYNITETYKKEMEQTGKTNNVSSTVGSMNDEQTSEAEQTETNETKTTANGNSTTKIDETVDDTKNETKTIEIDEKKTLDGEETRTEKADKAFLDTPQGLANLEDTKYITNLTRNDGTGKTETDNTETGEKTETVTGEGTGKTETARTATTTSNDTDTAEAERKQSGTSKQTTKQKTYNDNNTRGEIVGKQSENYTLTKKGNIGVDTDADMIEKHIKLQKKLQEIELMFFNECEDLFMLVY